MTSYWLGIDLGTTYTAAAICWPAADGLEVQVVPLSNHSHAIPPCCSCRATAPWWSGRARSAGR